MAPLNHHVLTTDVREKIPTDPVPCRDQACRFQRTNADLGDLHLTIADHQAALIELLLSVGHITSESSKDTPKDSWSRQEINSLRVPCRALTYRSPDIPGERHLRDYHKYHTHKTPLRCPIFKLLKMPGVATEGKEGSSPLSMTSVPLEEKVDGRSEVGVKKLPALEVAVRLNTYAPFISMTVGAVASSGLLSWEQSATTVDSPPIIPITLFWMTILSTLSLPLSTIAGDEMKDMQHAIEECKKRSPISSSGNLFKEATGDGVKRGPGDIGAPYNLDFEAQGMPKVICRCIRCCSKMRKFILYLALSVPTLFSIGTFFTFFVFLFALVSATETKTTVHIISYGCVMPMLGFFVTLGFFAKRILSRIA